MSDLVVVDQSLPLEHWNVDNVLAWLRSVSFLFGEYGPAFRRENITGSVLKTLTRDALIEKAGVTATDARYIVLKVGSLVRHQKGLSPEAIAAAVALHKASATTGSLKAARAGPQIPVPPVPVDGPVAPAPPSPPPPVPSSPSGPPPELPGSPDMPPVPGGDDGAEEEDVVPGLPSVPSLPLPPPVDAPPQGRQRTASVLKASLGDAPPLPTEDGDGPPLPTVEARVPTEPLERWSSQDVAGWLMSLSDMFALYTNLIQENEVDGITIGDLSRDDLENDLGFSKEAADMCGTALAMLRGKKESRHDLAGASGDDATTSASNEDQKGQGKTRGSLETWSCEDVCEWLQELDRDLFKSYLPMLKDNDVDGITIRDLATDDLETDLGFSSEAARVCGAALAPLRRGRRGSLRNIDVNAAAAAAAAAMPFAQLVEQTHEMEKKQAAEMPPLPPDEEEQDAPGLPRLPSADPPPPVPSAAAGDAGLDKSKAHFLMGLDKNGNDEAKRGTKGTGTGAAGGGVNEYLMIGGRLLKYGRFGNPKPKFVCVSVTRKCIVWAPSPEDAYRKRDGQKGKSISGSEVPLDIAGATVLAGKRTTVLRRGVAKDAPSSHCFSLLFQSRSLDFECESASVAKQWVDSLRSYLSSLSK